MNAFKLNKENLRNNLKTSIARSLSKKHSYKKYTNSLVDNIAKIVSKEKSKNLYFKDKPFFSDSTLKTIIMQMCDQKLNKIIF